MTALVNHFAFEFRTGIRDKSQLLMNYLFPLGFYFVISLFMGQLNPGFRDTMIPGMIVFTIISATVLGMPNPLVSSRESGIYRSYKINGVPATSIITIPALTTGIHVIIAAVIITVTAPLLFGAPLPVNWPGFMLIVLLTAFVCAGFGVLIGVISSNTRITILWSQLIFLPSMMLGGIMVPHNLLPPALSKVSLLLPATYAMDAFQGIAFMQDTGLHPIWSVVILLGSGILAFILAQYLFSWDSRNTARRGRPLMAALVLVPLVAGMFLM
jgi:ABC-2 type transport system permease protein